MAESKGTSRSGKGRKGKGKGADPQVLGPGESPFQSPYDGSPQNPADQEQSVMQSLGPVVQALLQFETDLMTVITSQLANAESALSQVDDDFKSSIAGYFAVPMMALNTVARDSQRQITAHLANAAMALSGATGEPVALSDVMAVPLPPTTLATASQPYAAGMPQEVRPVGPPSRPVQPVAPAPGPIGPIRTPPATKPTTGVPSLPGPLGPGKTVGPAVGEGTVVSIGGINAVTGMVGATTSGATAVTRGGLDPGGCYPTQAQIEAFAGAPPPGWTICPPAVPRQPGTTAGVICLGLTGEAAANPMESGGYWCPTGAGGGTPTPTPTPVGPTPTPAPTPTPTPIPTPSPPTPPPGPQPPTGPCPPGTAWGINAAGAWQCLPTSPTPTPTPTPIPPLPPIPTPTPTPVYYPVGGVGAIVAGNCGGTRNDPCFVAASSPGSTHPSLNITPGVTHELVRQGTADVSPAVAGVKGLNLGINLADNAANITACTTPYQLSIADVSAGLITPFKGGIDLNKMINDAMGKGTLAERINKVWLLGPINAFVAIIWQTFLSLASTIIVAFGGANATLARLASQEFVFAVCNALCLGSLRKYGRMLGYTSDIQYPIGLPSPAQAGQAWLAGTIDDCTYKTYVCAGDMRFEPFDCVVKSQKFTLTADQVVTLNARNQLQRGTLQSRLRELGSIETADQAELRYLFSVIPGPADLIRFMQRDVFNQQVNTTFGLSAGFADNFTAQLVTWADGQGVTPDIMLAEWKAHWSIPSPTQLYEMLHKLRHNPAFGGVQKVTSDVELALRQQDILPYWIPQLMAVSYHPLTRTDLNRAYEKGWISDDDYVQGMYLNGYSDDDAQTLLRFAGNERTLAILHSDFVREYADGYIDSTTLGAMAGEEGYDPSLIPQIGNLAIERRNRSYWRRAMSEIARQYKACIIDEDEATQAAQEAGIPDDVIAYNLQIALYGSKCGTRREWQATLCALLTTGDITPDQYVARMKVLKYDDTAIQNYLTYCQNKIAASQAKQALAAQKAAQKAADAETRAETRAAQQALAQANRTARALAAAERSRQARNKRLEDAAFLLGTYLSDSTGPPSMLVDALFSTLTREIGLSQNEAASVISSGATHAKGMSTQEFIDWAQAAGTAGLREPWTLFPGGIGITNGV